MIAIENTKECYVQLWLRLEHTRQLLEQQGRRFCVRSLIRSWWPELTVKGELYIIGGKSFDDFVWEVCHMAEIEGYQHLQPPSLYPRKHREILRTIVAICLHTGVLKRYSANIYSTTYRLYQILAKSILHFPFSICIMNIEQKIQQAATSRGDRPVDDITMKMAVIS